MLLTGHTLAHAAEVCQQSPRSSSSVRRVNVAQDEKRSARAVKRSVEHTANIPLYSIAAPITLYHSLYEASATKIARITPA